MFPFFQIKNAKELSEELEFKNLKVKDQFGMSHNLNWRLTYTERDFSKVPKFKDIVHGAQILMLNRKISRDLLIDLICEKLMENEKLNTELKLLKNEIHDLKSKLL
ncbi:hypothetical protein ACTFIR_001618 [Dictyostelium discoideum]